ncbi:MAG: heavy metal-responsive transcriptional regulator [Dehalococcoidia bacterium]
MQSLTSLALARAAGVNPQTIRYYERRGLIPKPPRTGAGYRQFPPDTLRRVQFVRQAQALGFTLKEIRALLDLRVRPGVGCADIRQRTREKIADIHEKIESLRRMEEALTRLANRCRGRGPVEECPILDALDAGDAAPPTTSGGKG